MDNKNKFTASLNAYMAKHKLNTNATSAAMG
ncbi:hemagglutinin protein, partial [Lacticaseibacillus paracasei]